MKSSEEHGHGSHVMPDGTVMEGSHHHHEDHGANDHHGSPGSERLKAEGSTQAHQSAPMATKRSMVGAPEMQVEYTCPMHPQIRQMGPGNCPICGMALEPVLATAQTGES